MFFDRIVREPECLKMTGLSQTTIWRLEKLGNFPKRHKLTKYAVGWRESEIAQWINQSFHEKTEHEN